MLLALGCAPKQRIPLDVEPADAVLYLDGEALESLPSELEVRRDRDHKLFFKREGYRPEMVVLEVRHRDDEARLEPDRVRVRLAPVAPKVEGELIIELED